ncbi:hypothetical protein B0H21DRAFT_715943 [Amylocystis lapponica]|nr:hypothetical protein B0H21DRAFT_715943 [Amylocystis lapponica]
MPVLTLLDLCAVSCTSAAVLSTLFRPPVVATASRMHAAPRSVLRLFGTRASCRCVHFSSFLGGDGRRSWES